MKFKNLTLAILFGAFLFSTSFSQNWNTEWGVQNTQKDASVWMEILDIDYQNNIYTGTMFGDSIFIEDTIFTHSGYYDWANWAIVKYDDQGRYVTAFDIVSMHNKNIYRVELVTDKDLNMYIACEFQQLAHLLDTTIYHGNVYEPDMPELFLAKITPSLDVEWIQLISSNSQDQCQGLAISPDNYIYMATSHSGYAGSVDTVFYMGQDTATYKTSLCSILKIDLKGKIIWRNELHASSSGVTIRGINTDYFNNITLAGYLRDSLFYSNDTIFHPHPGENIYRPFIIEIDSSGELISGAIPDWHMPISDIDRDDYGNFYFAGFVWDTVYFGSDTLIQHEDSTVNILAKLNPEYEPVWYETISAKSAYGSYYFNIDMDHDTMFFVGQCNRTFTIFDTVFNFGIYNKALVGKVTPDGELDKFSIVEATWGFKRFKFQLDNCNNMVVSGEFRGLAYFGQDTLESYAAEVWDGIMTKINRHDPYAFSFGPDTIVCDSITLTGPEGYQYYYWNDEPGQYQLNVTESGEYIFACVSDGGCWIKDTINIAVQPGFAVDIGQDTIITLLDTLYLSVPDNYDSYLWSTGSTENYTEITGNSTGLGNWDIWVEVIQGACFAHDTIQLSIIDAINELQDIFR